MITAEQRRRSTTTYVLDLTRSPFAGILEAGMQTFVLLIAIRLFNPDPFFKAMIPASISIGLLASPFVLSLASRYAIRATRMASLCWLGSGALMYLASLSPNFIGYLAALSPSMFCFALVPTFMIFAYAHNYRPHQRGQRIAVFFIISSLSGGIFGYFAGQALDANILYYRSVMWAFSGAAVGSAICGFFMPSPVVEAQHNASPLKNISLAWTDKLFGWMLASWMFIGFANLMTIPLRVEYLASPRYGVQASNSEITLVLIIIPLVCRILSTRIWGYLFDKINLLVLRSILNTMFLVSIFCFFRTKDTGVMAIATAIMGLAQGGGNIAWNLWVTKIATPDKTAAYMSVHTATTGIRGLLSPFLGFAAIYLLGPGITSIVAASFALVSILINLPLIRDERLRSHPQ